MTYLWLDDTRNPEDGWIKDFVGDVIWVKSYDEFVKWITQNGLPDRVSFDHDLADEHYQELFDDKPDLALPEHYHVELDYESFREKTGYDCAKWLVEYCIHNKKAIPLCQVHSFNPVGKKNIQEYLLYSLKHLINF